MMADSVPCRPGPGHPFVNSREQFDTLMQAAEMATDTKLKALLQHGVGWVVALLPALCRPSCCPFGSAPPNSSTRISS